MGAGASSVQELEAVVACTFLLGQAVSRVFPDIYTLDDFDEFAKVQEQRAYDKAVEDAEGAEGDNGGDKDAGGATLQTAFGNMQLISFGGTGKPREPVDVTDLPEEESAYIMVPFQGRKLAILKSNLGTPNADGWTPLHAACHQFSAAEAAALIIEEMSAQGQDFNLKTLRGPGSFASSWTPLHIASAYGIASTAEKLIEAGANLNEKNALEWTPLHEAVHRGYEDVVRALCRAGVQLNIVAAACLMSPQHAQYPLAHACRQGHFNVAKILIDAGANKNAQNEQGWTALHEAAHFNQIKIVELLSRSRM